jgi:hypothetical protein
VFATHGKSYYLAGAYPSIFALGAAALGGLRRPIIAIWMACKREPRHEAVPLCSTLCVGPVESAESEARLHRSGIAWTMLRPYHFMSSFRDEIDFIDADHRAIQRSAVCKVSLYNVRFAFKGAGFGWVADQQARFLACLY